MKRLPREKGAAENSKETKKVRTRPCAQAVRHGKMFPLEIPLHCGLNMDWNMSQGKAMHEIQNANRK